MSEPSHSSAQKGPGQESSDLGTEAGNSTPSEQQREVSPASQSDRAPRSAYASMNAGYTLLASVGVGLVIGYAIDEWAGTRPWWMAGMAGLFIIAGLYQVVKQHWNG